jgi:hypothetical protein
MNIHNIVFIIGVLIFAYLLGKYLLSKHNKCIICWENSGFLIKNSRCPCNYHYHSNCIRPLYIDTCLYCKKKFINPYIEYANVPDRTIIYMLNPKIALVSLILNIMLFGFAYWKKIEKNK